HKRRQPRSPPHRPGSREYSSFRGSACPRPPVAIQLVNFAEDLGNIISEPPGGVLGLEVGDIADPPYVIAPPVFLDIFPGQRLAGDFLAKANGFQHGAIAEASSAHVINFS